MVLVFGGRVLLGLGILCLAIRFPITTNALPISSPVPLILTVRAPFAPVVCFVILILAFDMVAVSLRPWPLWPMRWPTRASGTTIVQSSCSAVLCVAGSRFGGMVLVSTATGWQRGKEGWGDCAAGLVATSCDIRVSIF